MLLWLQGGPGGPSVFGLFIENGPLVVDKSGNGKHFTTDIMKYILFSSTREECYMEWVLSYVVYW